MPIQIDSVSYVQYPSTSLGQVIKCSSFLIKGLSHIGKVYDATSSDMVGPLMLFMILLSY